MRSIRDKRSILGYSVKRSFLKTGPYSNQTHPNASEYPFACKISELAMYTGCSYAALHYCFVGTFDDGLRCCCC